ncbi:putative fad dependent oxidoreductase protein [Hirsutella rhossiliensis]|uniref:Fad dependent oxidoreductase protein n=1 Tax=Hirsutella rhossiliensis TaxID=111463 RepID=A0A9P8SF43_9HYPO|nr:putative fad dependent oxidoreductase protein [Hirsutella rhossiliensis]KAH0959045.1 putative fad dependent oxidoreductase protein [Hirsutella rhossiliensis]
MGAAISHIRDGVSLAAASLHTLSSLHASYQQLLRRASRPPGLPVASPTASYWLDDPPFAGLPDIQGALPAEADVVLVGSGIAAAATAKALLDLDDREPPLSVVVIEARQLCGGATGRNGGHVKVTPHHEFARLRKRLGPERARVLVRFQLMHLPVLLGLGDAHPLGEVREVQTSDLYTDSSDFEGAARDVEAMREWMPEVEVEVLEGDEAREKIGVNGQVVGAISYKAGVLWPYRLVTSVWNGLLKQYPNLAIRTHTPVEAIVVDKSSPHPYRLHHGSGVVAARHVVHATNGFAAHLVPSLRGRLTGVLGHMTAQRPGVAFPASHGRRSWSVLYPGGFEYAAQRKDQGLDQLGVWDDGRLDALPLMHLRGSMQTVFEPRWGDGGGLVKAWTGIMGFTGDTLPLVGRLPEDDAPPAGRARRGESRPGQWIAAGFNGEGMERDLAPGDGRPGGRLAEWFPVAELAVDEARLRRAELRNLLNDVM